MPKIVRTPTHASGGITDKEKTKMAELVKKYTALAFRTEPINKEKITDAILRLYAAANLKKPRVIIVPSPLVMALASGIAKTVWDIRTKKLDATDKATDAATYAATYAATHEVTDAVTYAATHEATDAVTFEATHEATDTTTYAATHEVTYAVTFEATHEATDAVTRTATDNVMRVATRAATYAETDEVMRDATFAATDGATRAATYAATETVTDDATHTATYAVVRDSVCNKNTDLKSVITHLVGRENLKDAVANINNWSYRYQGGNMWSSFLCYADAMKNVIGLTGLKCWDKFQSYWDAGMEGGFRALHPTFCIVSDFPEKLEVDNRNRPHSLTGPSHRWRDGFEIYHLWGVRLSREEYDDIVVKKMPVKNILKITNADKRAVALKYAGAERFFDELKPKKIDEAAVMRKDGQILEYALYEVQDITQQTEKLLRYKSASFSRTGLWHTKFVDPKYQSAIEAIANSHHLTPMQYEEIEQQS